MVKFYTFIQEMKRDSSSYFFTGPLYAMAKELTNPAPGDQLEIRHDSSEDEAFVVRLHRIQVVDDLLYRFSVVPAEDW